MNSRQYLELDVHQTKDNVLIVLHDKTIDRTTNGSGKVCDLMFDEIQRYNAGSWFGVTFNREKIPTLAGVLSILHRHPDLKAIIEIKGNEKTYPGIAQRVVELVNKMNLTDKIIYKSFDPKMLEHLEKLSPRPPRLYVFLWAIPGISLTINASLRFHSPFNVRAEYLQEHYYFIKKNFVNEAHRRGYKVIAWGVDTKDQMQKALKLGVDGIETDHLDLLYKMAP